MVFGTFDIVHAGHLSLFRQARRYGKKLIVVVARDATAEKIKGKAPFHNEQERVALLKQLRNVDQVLLGDLRDAYKAIRRIKPDVIALGYDQEAFVDALNTEIREIHKPIRIIRLRPHQSVRYKTSEIRRFYAI